MPTQNVLYLRGGEGVGVGPQIHKSLAAGPYSAVILQHVTLPVMENIVLLADVPVLEFPWIRDARIPVQLLRLGPY
jgi:hypothetical protein